MSGAIPPLPNTPSRRGAQFKSTGTTLALLYPNLGIADFNSKTLASSITETDIF